MRFSSTAFLVWLALPINLTAQGNAQKKNAPVSVIRGHVFCADTNGPARLATVMLEPAGALDNQQPEKPEAESTSSPAVHMSSIQTLPDGSFTLKGVSPGTYYVEVSSPGYVSSIAALGFSEDDFKALDENAKKLVRKSMPRVVVEANLPAAIDVTLERGAAVSGTVLYDDGSPASGISVDLLIRNTTTSTGGKKNLWVERARPPAGGEMGASTDDRGNFRISALPAHEYVLKATLGISKYDYMVSGNGMSMYSSGGNSVQVYSGSKTRMKEAISFKVKLGEERSGEDLTIPLGKLHRVSGNITAAHDGHIINGGTVTLLNADDKTEVEKADLNQDDAAFTFDFVAEGDYILRATNAADVEYVESTPAPGDMSPPHFDAQKQHSYGTADQPIHVDAELTGATIAVPEKDPAK